MRVDKEHSSIPIEVQGPITTIYLVLQGAQGPFLLDSPKERQVRSTCSYFAPDAQALPELCQGWCSSAFPLTRASGQMPIN